MISRRDFFKLLGVGALGAIIPNKGLEALERNTEMNVGDLFVKLADGTPLSQEEKQQLRLHGNQTQLNNSFVAGLQNGQSEINVSNAKVSGNIYTGKDVVSGIAVRVRRSASQTIAATPTLTTIAWNNEDYDDANMFSLSDNTKIIVPVSGRYNVTIGAFISGPSAAYSVSTYRGSTSYYPAFAFFMGGFNSSATDEREYIKGEEITVKISNTSASTATLVAAYFTMRLVRL